MEKTLIIANVNFLMDEGDNKVWLAKKTRKIGIGLFNGYGGKVDHCDKNLIASSKREIRQECGVRTSVKNFEKVAIVDFYDNKIDRSVIIIRVHAYLVRNWKGIPRETEEMAEPKLFNKNRLPLKKMMEADKEWVPLIMQGKKLIATYYYDPWYKLIKKGPLKIVDSLPN